MLLLIKHFFHQLSQKFNSFAIQHGLCELSLQTNLFYLNNLNNDNNRFIIINCQLKGSERQSFDIRISLQKPCLQQWWPLLPQLTLKLENEKDIFILPISNVKLFSKSVLDINLNHYSSIPTLLYSFNLVNDSFSSMVKQYDKIVLINLNLPTSTYFQMCRFNFLISFVENILSAAGYDFTASEQFNSFFTEKFTNLKNNLCFELTEKYNLSNQNEKTIQYFHIIFAYLTQLNVELGNSLKKNFLIIFTPLSDLCNLKDCLHLVQLKFNLKWKIIKVAPVFIQQLSEIKNFNQFKMKIIEQHLSTAINVSNGKFIIYLMLF